MLNKIKEISKQIFFNMPILFAVSILFMDLVAIAAPVLAHYGFTGIAHVIYFIYSFLCHQRPWRSLHLFDFQVAWCTRDTFIYLSMGLAAISVVLFKIRGVKWYIALLSLLPFAADGIVQFIAEFSGLVNNQETYFYASTNFIRMLTGSIFGAGSGLWLFSLLAETLYEEFEFNIEKKKIKPDVRKNIITFMVIIFICFISYITFIQIWDATSLKYKPAGLLDNVRYFPGVNYEETEGGGHGV